jgi:hypothetical protein
MCAPTHVPCARDFTLWRARSINVSDIKIPFSFVGVRHNLRVTSDRSYWNLIKVFRNSHGPGIGQS